MISKTIGFRGTQHFQTHPYMRYRSIMSIHPGSTIPETPFWHSFWHTIWKYIWHIYSGILSDILSGIYFDILFYLTLYLASILTYLLACILTFFLACIHILSGILSGTYSDIFSGMHSGILSGIYSDMTFGIPRWFQKIPFYKSVLLKWMLSLGLRFINWLNAFWLILTDIFTRGSRLSTTQNGHQDFRVAGVYCIDVNFIEDWDLGTVQWSEDCNGCFAEKIGEKVAKQPVIWTQKEWWVEYPAWWTHSLQWKDPPIFHGKIYYFYGHFQLQTVSSPEGNF